MIIRVCQKKKREEKNSHGIKKPYVESLLLAFLLSKPTVCDAFLVCNLVRPIDCCRGGTIHTKHVVTKTGCGPISTMYLKLPGFLPCSVRFEYCSGVYLEIRGTERDSGSQGA